VKSWEAGPYHGIDLRPLAGQTSYPTLLVAGELDLICDPAQAGPTHMRSPTRPFRSSRNGAYAPAIEKAAELRHVVLDWLG
jgi:hypothetical protein